MLNEGCGVSLWDKYVYLVAKRASKEYAVLAEKRFCDLPLNLREDFGYCGAKQVYAELDITFFILCRDCSVKRGIVW